MDGDSSIQRERSLAMKSENPPSSYQPENDEAQAAPRERSRFDDTEETYVPSTDMDDSSLAPTGLDNPFWT
jgi:hypothetical protein